MKPITQLILILLLTFTVAPVYAGDVDDLLEEADELKRRVIEAQRKSHFSNKPITVEDKNRFEELEKLANLGDAEAQREFGLMHYKGLGTVRGEQKAIKWFKLSISNGNALAARQLYEVYSRGYGVAEDYTESKKWLKLSAEMGDVTGQGILGGKYFLGRRGFVEDLVLSHMWFNISVANGSSSTYYKTMVEEYLTPDQLAEAQKLAREWMEEHYKN